MTDDLYPAVLQSSITSRNPSLRVIKTYFLIVYIATVIQNTLFLLTRPGLKYSAIDLERERARRAHAFPR